MFTFLRLEDFKERRGDITGLSRDGPVMDRIRSLSSLNETSTVNLSNGNKLKLMGDKPSRPLHAEGEPGGLYARIHAAFLLEISYCYAGTLCNIHSRDDCAFLLLLVFWELVT